MRTYDVGKGIVTLVLAMAPAGPGPTSSLTQRDRIAVAELRKELIEQYQRLTGGDYVPDRLAQIRQLIRREILRS
jgi:hypothetical protein